MCYCIAQSLTVLFSRQWPNLPIGGIGILKLYYTFEKAHSDGWQNRIKKDKPEVRSGYELGTAEKTALQQGIKHKCGPNLPWFIYSHLVMRHLLPLFPSHSDLEWMLTPDYRTSKSWVSLSTRGKVCWSDALMLRLSKCELPHLKAAGNRCEGAWFGCKWIQIYSEGSPLSFYETCLGLVLV